MHGTEYNSMGMLALPVEVVCNFVLPLLSVRDLRALDNAYTNRYNRLQLREVWKSYQYSCLDMVLNESSIAWLCRIGVQIISVAMLPSELESVITSISTLTKLHMKSTIYHTMLLNLAINNPELEELCLMYVRGTNTDEAIACLALHCLRLHTLHISSNQLTDDGIRALCSNCLYLRHLGLSTCVSLTDASLTMIGNSFPRLQSVRLHSDHITDDGLLHLATQCHELQSLAVRGSGVTSRGLFSLWAANPHLTDVTISYCQFVSDEDIMQLVKCCPLVRKLYLSHCYSITDDSVIAVAEHCPHLLALDINCTYNITDASLIALGQHCHELISINISCHTKITQVGLAALASGCPLLQELVADSCRINDAGMIALAELCSDLRKVYISCCKISIAAISAIAINCRLLSELIIQECDGVDDDCLCVIAQHCRNLTVLELCDTNVSGCLALQNVITSCRMLRKINSNNSFKPNVAKTPHKVVKSCK